MNICKIVARRIITRPQLIPSDKHIFPHKYIILDLYADNLP